MTDTVHLVAVPLVVSSEQKKSRRQRKPTIAPPDGLRSPQEAAAKLRCSIKTLNGHIASGALAYVIIGHGTKRPRRGPVRQELEAPKFSAHPSA
jgi:hypothetical protein